MSQAVQVRMKVRTCKLCGHKVEKPAAAKSSLCPACQQKVWDAMMAQIASEEW